MLPGYLPLDSQGMRLLSLPLLILLAIFSCISLVLYTLTEHHRSPDMSITHVVLFHFKSSVTAEVINDVRFTMDTITS